MSLTVDGKPVHLGDTVAYKAMMLSGVPNFAFAFGYTNSSWTLKVGLLCEHFCRLLSHMDARGHDIARPEIGDQGIETRPMLDLAAGYVQRALDRMPKQGAGEPWRVSMNYYYDVEQLREGSVEDPNLYFVRSASRTPAASAPAARDRTAGSAAPLHISALNTLPRPGGSGISCTARMPGTSLTRFAASDGDRLNGIGGTR